MITATSIIVTGDDVKRIEDIVNTLHEQDVHVRAYNESRHKILDCEVTSTRGSSSKELIMIKTKRDDSLIMTHDHKVFGDNKWVRADKLHTGILLLNSDLESVELVEIHTIHNPTAQKVYNLTVDKTRNFFANNILVHNDC